MEGVGRADAITFQIYVLWTACALEGRLCQGCLSLHLRQVVQNLNREKRREKRTSKNKLKFDITEHSRA